MMKCRPLFIYGLWQGVVQGLRVVKVRCKNNPLKLLAVLPHDRCGRFKPNADAAALVDVSALSGNSTDDILSGQYRCHVAATLTGRLSSKQLLMLIVSRPQACNW